VALDTVTQRLSIINLGSPWRGVLPIPDGSTDDTDRPVFYYYYAKAAAAVEVPNPGGRITGGTFTRGRWRDLDKELARAKAQEEADERARQEAIARLEKKIKRPSAREQFDAILAEEAAQRAAEAAKVAAAEAQAEAERQAAEAQRAAERQALLEAAALRRSAEDHETRIALRAAQITDALEIQRRQAMAGMNVAKAAELVATAKRARELAEEEEAAAALLLNTNG
jgi:hypothetical protein